MCLYAHEVMCVHMYKFSNSDKTGTCIFPGYGQAMHADVYSSFCNTFNTPRNRQRQNFIDLLFYYFLFFFFLDNFFMRVSFMFFFCFLFLSIFCHFIFLHFFFAFGIRIC